MQVHVVRPTELKLTIGINILSKIIADEGPHVHYYYNESNNCIPLTVRSPISLAASDTIVSKVLISPGVCSMVCRNSFTANWVVGQLSSRHGSSSSLPMSYSGSSLSMSSSGSLFMSSSGYLAVLMSRFMAF